MSTVIENIDSLFSVKSDIRQAIVDKGVDMTSVPFTSFATKIGEISIGSNPNLMEVSVLQGAQTQEVIPESYGDDVDGFSKVTITLDPSLPDTYKAQALNELTEATATEEDVAQGQKYYDNKGVLKTGTMQGGGGDTDIEDVFITRTLSGAYTNARVTKICSYVFQSCTSLTTVSFPVCTSIGSYAFNGCTSLTTVSFPVCTSIGNAAFGFCSSLTNISFPVCTTIGTSAFTNCSTLTTVLFPACTSIGTSGFAGGYTFWRCFSLTTASFPVCTSIGSSAFGYCSSLSALYLNEVSSVTKLANSSVFNSTPMKNSSYLGYYGSIYVPMSLVDQFKTATNWTYYADRIVGV